MRKECPQNASTSARPPPYSKARVSKLPTVNETEEEGGPQDLKELARSMAILDADKQDELFDLLLNGDQDF
jgi:hypothetical protein